MNCLWGLSTLLFLGSLLLTSLTEGRHIQAKHEDIPTLLSRLYAKVGEDQFIASWKEFNSRSDIQQDDFLTDGLADNELVQLEDDFNRFAEALTEQPQLIDFYAEFEQNLSFTAFKKMDELIGSSEPWWERLKRFLYRKMEKLAGEILLRGKL